MHHAFECDCDPPDEAPNDQHSLFGREGLEPPAEPLQEYP